MSSPPDGVVCDPLRALRHPSFTRIREDRVVDDERLFTRLLLGAISVSVAILVLVVAALVLAYD
jgi:hypothetical protein